MLFSVVAINLKTYLLQGIGFFFMRKTKSALIISTPIENSVSNYTQQLLTKKTLTFVSAFFTRYFRNFHERHLAKLKFEPHQYVSYEART